MSFFGTSPRAQPEGECLKNHRFECEVRSWPHLARSARKKGSVKLVRALKPLCGLPTFF